VLFLLLLLQAPLTPTPTPSTRIVILSGDPTPYTAPADYEGQRLIILKRPDGKTISATPGDIDRAATKRANLPPPPVQVGRTPVPASTRTLREAAKDRPVKGKGSLSVAGRTFADAEETPGEDGEKKDKAKEPPRVRVMSVENGGIDDNLMVNVTGSIRNNGPGAACDVKIGLTVISTQGETIGSGTANADSPKIPRGESSGFKGSVRVPAGTQFELRGDGFTTLQNPGSRGPKIEKADARIDGVTACD